MARGKAALNMIKLVLGVYLTECVVLVLNFLFAVPKGTEYIRIVFAVNVGGLNDALWDHNCMLPVMGSLIRIAGPETHKLDLDVVEMFYNFIISSVLSK